MKILVVRARPLGELLCAVPALRALREAYPLSRITLVGLPAGRELAARLRRYLDGFAAFPGFPGLHGIPSAVGDIPGFFAHMRAQRFDLALQMHDEGRLMNPLTVLMGAECNAGFHARGAFRPDPGRFLEWRPDEQEVARWLRLLEHLGVRASGTELEFPFVEADWRAFQRLRLAGLAYAVVHPGYRQPGAWPLERFAELADALAAEGLRIVLGGTPAQSRVAGALRAEMREPAIDLAGRLSLGTQAAVIARARVLVSDDLGATQIAVAVRTPSVGVAPAPDAERLAPPNRELHRRLRPQTTAEEAVHDACGLARRAA